MRRCGGFLGGGLRSWLVSAYLFDDLGCGLAFDQGDGGDSASVGFDFFASDDFFGLIVSAFDEDVGQEGGDKVFGRVFGKGDNIVDAFECGEYAGAVFEGQDGAVMAFETAYGFVGVEAQEEGFAVGAGFLEIGDVAAVDEVKTAVGKDDFCADVFEAVAYLDGLIPGDDFVIGDGVFERMDECVPEQGNYEFVVAGKGIAFAALHGGALYDVDARAIVLDHVEVGR